MHGLLAEGFVQHRRHLGARELFGQALAAAQTTPYFRSAQRETIARRAQKLVASVAKRIGIEPIFFDEVFYCVRCRGMASAKTCGHGGS